MQTERAVKPVYLVATVEKIETPDGMSGSNWHRYVIKRKGSEIEGMKPGTLKSVTLHAESVAENLNLRAGGGNTSYAARKRSS